MRMQMTSQIDAGGNDPIFLMFHGYGNDESEMMRILDAVYAPTRADAAPAAIAAVPSYISFRATYARPYMGGNYWYPDGCGVDERQRTGGRLCRLRQGGHPRRHRRPAGVTAMKKYKALIPNS